VPESLRFQIKLASRLMSIAALAAVVPVALAACGGKVVVDGGSGGAGGQGGQTSVTASGQGGSVVATSNGPGPGGTGRPFLVGDRAIAAEARRSAARGWAAAPLVPDVSALSREDRAALAEAWANDGRMEHASIASFSRFALELMAAGAPADLVEGAHRAALDEIEHARLCFGLASAYAGEAIAPGAFPFGGSVEVRESLPAIAAAIVREGCVGETLAALAAAEQRELATDPAVRAALQVIAEDEGAHAELAWRAVAWAIAEGGESVRRVVAEAFAEAERGALAADEMIAERSNEALAAHGRPGAAAMRAVSARGLAEVVLPAARALLGSARSTGSTAGAADTEQRP
jgi:hypothetical protein